MLKGLNLVPFMGVQAFNQSKISKSLQQIIQLLQLNLFTRRSLLDLLQPPDQSSLPPPQLQFGLVRN